MFSYHRIIPAKTTSNKRSFYNVVWCTGVAMKFTILGPFRLSQAIAMCRVISEDRAFNKDSGKFVKRYIRQSRMNAKLWLRLDEWQDIEFHQMLMCHRQSPNYSRTTRVEWVIEGRIKRIKISYASGVVAYRFSYTMLSDSDLLINSSAHREQLDYLNEAAIDTSEDGRTDFIEKNTKIIFPDGRVLIGTKIETTGDLVKRSSSVEQICKFFSIPQKIFSKFR